MISPAALLASPLDRRPGAPPRQRQLIQRLRSAILAGQFPAGARLPSSRTLSEELGISRNTVLIAYEQLTAEGYVVADRQGTRVAALSRAPVRSAPGPAAPAAAAARRLERITQARQPRAGSPPFTASTPALDQFPLGAWRRALERALRESPAATLDYGDPLGEPALREAIAQHLRVSRGVRCEAAGVVITEGAQGALSLCVQLLTNPGDAAWLEDPGYRGAKAAFYAGDLDVTGMRVDADGIVIPESAWTRPPRLIQTTPSHQYPTGAVLSLARRLDLLERARRAGAWIIEDDYDSEFRHLGEPIAAMQGLLPDAPVLYVGTFSKTMFPSLRLGFLVLPQAIAGATLTAAAEMLRGGRRLDQLSMAAFIGNGQFARHLGRMRRLYRERQAALRDALAAHLGVDHEVLGGHGGLHLTLRLPPEFPDRALAAQARQAGMNPGALSSFALAPRPEDNGLVLGYGNTDASRYPALVKRLARLLRQMT